MRVFRLALGNVPLEDGLGPDNAELLREHIKVEHAIFHIIILVAHNMIVSVQSKALGIDAVDAYSVVPQVQALETLGQANLGRDE